MSAILERDQTIPGLRFRQRQARDEAILAAAYDLIEEKGYEGMTMDELANRLAIAKRTLYHHFPSKEAIAAATMTARAHENVRRVREDWPEMPAIVRLENILRWLVGRRLVPEHSAASEIRAHPELMAAIRSNPEYRQAADLLLAAIAAIAEEAQRAGDMDTNIPPTLAAHLLLGVVRGTHWDEILLASRGRAGRVVEAAVTAYMNGIRGGGRQI